MELLRIITAGSVDDGKSTLIGRLLYDAKALQKDQLRSLERLSRKKGLSYLDFSLVTDGLKDEMAQGITIDIAHRYFNTKHRKYIIADTPGHVEYTRNYVTAASGAQVAVLLIDARKSVTTQTRRHAWIAAMMGIRHLVFCINKMDLVNYSVDVYNSIKETLKQMVSALDVIDVFYIPVVALQGENVVAAGNSMPWYRDKSVLATLEEVTVNNYNETRGLRFAVQTAIRNEMPGATDNRLYAGRIDAGQMRQGDEITVLPAGTVSHIKNIFFSGQIIESARSGMSITISLEDDIDISRGSVIVSKHNMPFVTQEIEIVTSVLAKIILKPNDKYAVRTATQEAKAIVRSISYKLDIDNMRQVTSDQLHVNDLGAVKLYLSQPIVVDQYEKERTTGGVILIDERSNDVVAAGLVASCINM